MYEKILEKLKEQRQKVKQEIGTSNVSDRTLEDMAKSLETVITTDELLQNADLSNAIKSIDGNINNYTAQQVEDFKKTYKPEPKEEDKQDKTKAKTTEEKKDVDPVIAQLLEQNKTIMEQLQGMKSEKVTQTRGDILNKHLEGTPDIFKNATLKGFTRMKFDSDEEFEEYLTDVKDSAKEAIQVAQESGLNISSPKPETKKPDKEEVTPEMQKAIDKVAKPPETKGKF